MKIVLVCTRKDLYGMIFHALVIDFFQFVNLNHSDSKKPFMYYQSYEIKSPPLTILWFRILGIFSDENIKRLCVFMFQT